MKKVFFASILFAALNCFASSYSLNLEGKYECHGDEVGTHDAFKCEMIIKKTGETYSNIANCNDGNSYTGTGIYEQNLHRFSTGFINPKKSEETGIAVSKIKKDGGWVTVWTYLNKTTTGHSTCVKQRA